MSDFSPSGHTPSGGGSCKTRPAGYQESKYLGTLFYKTHLNGYTARQFRSSINNIEEVTLPDGSKKIFVLTDRGLYYIDNQDSLHRVSVPMKNLPINIVNIEDDKLIDAVGSRYYWNENNQTYEKSIVDNNGNKSANLKYYTSKALYDTITDERDNIVKCYVTSNGSYLSYLYEGYEGDRCWQIPISSTPCTYVFKDSRNVVFGISNNNLYTFSKANKSSWNLIECKYTESENPDLISITNIKYISELSYIDGFDPCLFLFCQNGSIYYTEKVDGSYDYNNFKKIDTIISYTDGQWTPSNDTITNVTSLNYDNERIIFSSNTSIYMLSKSLSVQDGKLSIIKNTTFNTSNCCNIMIDGDSIYAVTYTYDRQESENNGDAYYSITPRNKWWDYDVQNWSSISTNNKKVIPENWSLCLFHDVKDKFSSSSKFRFEVQTAVYNKTITTDHTYTYRLHKLLIQGNSFTSISSFLTTRYSYTNTVVKTIITSDPRYPHKVIVYKKDNSNANEQVISEINMSVSGHNRYIWYVNKTSVSNFYKNYSSGHCLSYINQDHSYTDGEGKEWSDIKYNNIVSSTSSNDSLYLLELLYNNKITKQIKVKNKPYCNGFHSVKSINNGALVATPIGLVTINSNQQPQEDAVSIDITGNTNFRELYELNYDAGMYQGNWFVFTTSDGLINCRAGDPDDSVWQPDWHIFKYGTSFWKIRFSSNQVEKDADTNKQIVTFSGAFTVKYPSYIN